MIRQPTASETASIKRLWALCFSDTAEDMAWYFENLYQPQQVWAEFEGDTPVAMLQLLPTELLVGEQHCKAAYLYGVCTHPDYRRQGRMRRLLETAEAALLKDGVAYAFLKPENPKIYLPFGYAFCSVQERYTKAFSAIPCTLCDHPSIEELDALWRRYQKAFPFGVLRDEAWWKKAIDCSGHARTLLKEGKAVAYAIFGDGVDELVSFDEKDTKALLGSISQGTPISVRTPAPFGEGYAMGKALGDAPPLEGMGCFGLLFD